MVDLAYLPTDLPPRGEQVRGRVRGGVAAPSPPGRPTFAGPSLAFEVAEVVDLLFAERAGPKAMTGDLRYGHLHHPPQPVVRLLPDDLGVVRRRARPAPRRVDECRKSDDALVPRTGHFGRCPGHPDLPGPRRFPS